LIRKAYNALTRIHKTIISDVVESEDMNLAYNDMENKEDGNENFDDIESKLIGRLFYFMSILIQLSDDNQLWSALLGILFEQDANYILLFLRSFTINVSEKIIL